MARRPPVRAKRPATAREMAERFNCSVSTVMRAIALPREEYLANALTRSKPWEKMGMSRATWYRKGKPEPVPENQQPE
jgi:DNA-binding transcriptional MocR family regulator